MNRIVQSVIEPSADDERLENEIGDEDINENGDPRPLDEIYSRKKFFGGIIPQ